MEDKLLRIVYTFFLGLIIALFVGMGISTFYPGPKLPEYPKTLEAREGVKNEAELMQIQNTYDEQYKKYEDESQSYHRNVSIISLAFAVAFLGIGLLYEKKNSVISNGIMLGGIFVLVYSIGRGIVSTDTRYTFIAVSVGLAIVLYLGYRRFGATSATKAKKRQ